MDHLNCFISILGILIFPSYLLSFNPSILPSFLPAFHLSHGYCHFHIISKKGLHASMLVDILNASVGFLSFMLEIWCSKLYFYFRLPDIFLYYLIQTMQGDQEKGHIHLVFLPSSLIYLVFINCFFFFPPFFYIFFLFT